MNTPPSTLSVSLWAANLETPAVSLAAWLDLVGARLAEARAAGSQLLMLPELSCIQWLGFAPPGLAANRQLPWLADMTKEALPGLRALAVHHGLALLAGTFPWTLESGNVANRAWLVLPDGRAYTQDKLFLTPAEQDPQAWLFTPGSQVNVIDWLGLRVAIVICLDTEATALWARLASLDLDLILAPAKTDGLSGYYRVFGCARARAIELQTVVCAVGAVGTVYGQPASDTGVGGAAVYLPCEAALNPLGVAAALDFQTPALGASLVLHAQQLPVGACRQIRHGAAEAEVCPGRWSAQHVSISDPAIPT